MNGAQWVVHALRAQGVETVFGYPGAHYADLRCIVWRRRGTPVVPTQQGAAMAAIGYARATGKQASAWQHQARAQPT